MELPTPLDTLRLDKLRLDILDKRDWMRVAELHKGKLLIRVTKKGLDYKGRQFKKYSRWYEDLLRRDFRTKTGKRVKGYQGISLNTSANKINNRVLELRGLTMANFGTRPVEWTGEGYIVGWTGEAAELVIKNADRGRDVMSGIPQDEYNFIFKELEKIIDRAIKKIPNMIDIK
jgi:hypothetical protein